jgi:NTP pyrophosphatase (non-canonical NTP hydrolase)
MFPYGDEMLGKLMLVVTEVSEAAEAVRRGDQDNYEEELADIFIRLLEICGTQGIDPEDIIERKMKINHGRPHLHGKKTTL